jgi:RNA recognition motif-containing protein
MSIRLYVGNLPEDLTRQELEAVFADAAGALSIKIITDRKTNKCRGFGFVTVKSEEEADEVIEKFNGFQLKDATLKIERAQPRAKEEGEDDAAPSAAVPAPSPRAGKKSGGGGNGGASGGGNKGRKSTAVDTDSVQPDPRWAQDLEKLKQLLAAQAANP